MHRRSRLLRQIIALLLGCAPCLAVEAFELSTLQATGGAIVLNPGGNYVEPYFATKALIVAQDGGLDIRDAAFGGIQWALPRQSPSGSFRRFCRTGNEWHDCAPADADDSMLALWMQLLYRMSPPSGMPPEWKRSVSSAAKELDKLYNRRLGVYHVSRRNHVALLMDNVEVYAALKDIAKVQARWKDPQAETTENRAEHLRASIRRIFWNQHSQWFRSSMQKVPPAFYPDAVAQVYPWLANMTGPGQETQTAWQRWKHEFGTGWITRQYDNHPWGLVALAAEKLGDSETSACWMSKSEPMRGSSAWNVLEEAAWQSLHARLSQPQLLNPQACSRILAAR